MDGEEIYIILNLSSLNVRNILLGFHFIYEKAL